MAGAEGCRAYCDFSSKNTLFFGNTDQPAKARRGPPGQPPSSCPVIFVRSDFLRPPGSSVLDILYVLYKLVKCFAAETLKNISALVPSPVINKIVTGSPTS